MARKNIYKKDPSDSNYFHNHYDRCTYPNCGYEFQEADWTYFGLDNSGHQQHVCENHRSNIQGACSPNIFGHMPKDIWRIKPYTVPCITYDSGPPQPDID